MLYFAYGSNMAFKRLAQRTPSAKRLGTYYLKEHRLEFHMLSTDGSGKCDAHFTGNKDDVVIGALYEIADAEQPHLDKAEGLGHSYGIKNVRLIGTTGKVVVAKMYYALRLGENLQPYDWYLHHVRVGAKEIEVPESYLQRIDSVSAIQDLDRQRHIKQMAIHS